jgi:hypothetical protein
VSLFRSFLIFASKRNEAKRILFRFIFACFCETEKQFFRFISHRFALIFFAISLQTFRFKTKKTASNNFFHYFAETFASKHFFRYLASTFSQCCGAGAARSRIIWLEPELEL